MEGHQTDIQALLQSISCGFGDLKHDQSPQSSLPPARPTSSSYIHQNEPSAEPRSSLSSISKQHPLYEAQIFRSLGTQSYGAYNDNGLGQFDQDLLNDLQSHWRWQANNSMGSSTAGRLSLPGHTRSHSPVKPFQHTKSQILQRTIPKPSSNPTTSTVRYAHTPSAEISASSSASCALPSSPSFVATQRRTRRGAHRDIHNTNTDNPRDRRPLVTSSVRDLRKGFVHEHRIRKFDINRDIICSTVPSTTPHQSLFSPQIRFDHTKPVVQGIPLISLDEIPDRLRSVFRYPLFNAIQSKCFPTAYKSDDNLVVSAPTGGGKTVILEMAICRLIHCFKTTQFKIVYMAPTKSLCSERQRDWQAKFVAFDLDCAELTGDTDQGQLRNVQSASIIITTPEKWDSMTRKWKDHSKLMQMVKLFLIDEVHILKDSRGATLEAVVSRMKSVGSNVRFVALSATVPNSEDIAAWLGRNHTYQHLPAIREKFGEEFRPVKLQKHVVGIPYRGNDFGFESACDPRLPDIIAENSHKKPIMIFCITRKSAVNTAKLLANMWVLKEPPDRHWEGPTQRLIVQDPELKNALTSGVAFHHAGLDNSDRHTVEQGFLEGQINVICCTSTLAVGVNLPCHMVIIKNTVSYQDDGIKEYADLEVMQMLGRAGRPQFDSTAVAVIITKQEKVQKYEKLVSGEELLESCLHLNLIDHLNAEIGLGTIRDLYTAKRWLAGTFLHVRLRRNPEHYKLDGKALVQGLEDGMERICKRDLVLLEETKLVTSGERLKATEFGEAMARYYVKFNTMQIFMRLQPRSKVSDILYAIVQAEEFRDIRLRANEKRLFREINNANGIKFPIKVELDMHAYKRSLIIQSELGGVDFPVDEQYVKHKRQFIQDKATLLSVSHRLICCVIDCQIHLRDAVTVRHALDLARSFGARAWDDSPLQMKQIAQVGLVTIRKLAMGGVNSIEVLEATEPHRIEMLMSKNPPFGHKLLANLRDFPKPRVSVKTMGKDSVRGWPAAIKIRAECGFLNDIVPVFFHRRPIYICLLTERSDGFLVDFRRIRSSKNLNNGQEILMNVELLNQTQYITCYIMCDGIAGTLRSAELRLDLPACSPPPPQLQERAHALTLKRKGAKSTRHIVTSKFAMISDTSEDHEFGDDDFNDLEIMNAVKDIESGHNDELGSRLKTGKLKPKAMESKANGTEQFAWNPERLENGKWACNHKCKDKTACKHLCCREGVEKAPKAPKNSVSVPYLVDSSHLLGHGGHRRRVVPAKKPAGISAFKNKKEVGIDTVDLGLGQALIRRDKTMPTASRSLNRLHGDAVTGKMMPIQVKKQPALDYTKQRQLQTSLSDKDASAETVGEKSSTDYDTGWMGDLPSPSDLLERTCEKLSHPLEHKSTEYDSSWPDSLPNLSAPICQNVKAVGDCGTRFSMGGSERLSSNGKESETEAAMVGLSDSVIMQEDWHVQAAIGQSSLQADAFQLNLQLPGVSASGLHYRSAGIEDSTDTSRLFFSTDGHKKETELKQKRKADVRDKAKDSSQSAPVAKRLRIIDGQDQARRRSSSVARPVLTSREIVRPGQPAWVYDIDPAFIVEWQDTVDFI